MTSVLALASLLACSKPEGAPPTPPTPPTPGPQRLAGREITPGLWETRIFRFDQSSPQRSQSCIAVRSEFEVFDELLGIKDCKIERRARSGGFSFEARCDLRGEKRTALGHAFIASDYVTIRVTSASEAGPPLHRQIESRRVGDCPPGTAQYDP
ncbi:MAG: hypothetical protein KBC34_14565 [Phenylobacterium sp.]|nr:hypothetical protein [Phenylobacterium sp.]